MLSALQRLPFPTGEDDFCRGALRYTDIEFQLPALPLDAHLYPAARALHCTSRTIQVSQLRTDAERTESWRSGLYPANLLTQDSQGPATPSVIIRAPASVHHRLARLRLCPLRQPVFRQCGLGVGQTGRIYFLCRFLHIRNSLLRCSAHPVCFSQAVPNT